MKSQSSKQLYNAFYGHIKEGRHCIYLCHDYRHCEYMLHLMVWMFEPNSVSIRNRMIFYKKGRIKFKSTADRSDQVLCGPPSFVVLDHAAIKKLNTVKRVEWKSLIDCNNERIMKNVC